MERSLSSKETGQEFFVAFKILFPHLLGELFGPVYLYTGIFRCALDSWRFVRLNCL